MKSKTDVEDILCNVLSSGVSRSLQFKRELFSCPREETGSHPTIRVISEWKTGKSKRDKHITCLVAPWETRNGIFWALCLSITKADSLSSLPYIVNWKHSWILLPFQHIYFVISRTTPYTLDALPILPPFFHLWPSFFKPQMHCQDLLCKLIHSCSLKSLLIY